MTNVNIAFYFNSQIRKNKNELSSNEEANHQPKYKNISIIQK